MAGCSLASSWGIHASHIRCQPHRNNSSEHIVYRWLALLQFSFVIRPQTAVTSDQLISGVAFGEAHRYTKRICIHTLNINGIFGHVEVMWGCPSVKFDDEYTSPHIGSCLFHVSNKWQYFYFLILRRLHFWKLREHKKEKRKIKCLFEEWRLVSVTYCKVHRNGKI